MESACNYGASRTCVATRERFEWRTWTHACIRVNLFHVEEKGGGENVTLFHPRISSPPSLPLRRRRCFVMPLYIQSSSTRRRPLSCIISAKFRRRSTHKCSFSFFILFFRDILSWIQRISNFLLRVFFLSFFSFFFHLPSRNAWKYFARFFI